MLTSGSETRRVRLLYLLSLFFIFTFWSKKSGPAFPFACCIKRTTRFKKSSRAAQDKSSHSAENGRALSSLDNSTAPPSSPPQQKNAAGVKRTCELPPVPDTTVIAAPRSGRRDWQVPLPTDDAPDCDARPYSLCGPPSESDALYACVSCPRPDTTSSPLNAFLDAPTSKGIRSRTNSEPEKGDPRISVFSRHRQSRRCATAAAAANCKNDDSCSAGSAVPYYSSIVADDLRPSCRPTEEEEEQPQHQPHRPTSPLYQEEPLLNQQGVVSRAPLANAQMRQQSSRSAYDVYSVPNAVALNDHSPSGQLSAIEASGPPVPSRSYGLSEVAHLNRAARRSLRPRSSFEDSAPDSTGNPSSRRRPLLERLYAGIRHHSQGVRPPQPYEEAQSASAEDGDENSASLSDDHRGQYRNITVRESIASLRARNALPLFLTDPRFRLPSISSNNFGTFIRNGQATTDAVYEGVYWYPNEVPGDQADGPYGTEILPAVSAEAGVYSMAEPTYSGSDAYTEIPDLSHARPPSRKSGRLDELRSSVPLPPTATAEPSQDSPVTSAPVNDQADRRSPLLPTAQMPLPEHAPNLNRILLEMQGFRHVDSDMDLSRAPTPSISSPIRDPPPLDSTFDGAPVPPYVRPAGSFAVTAAAARAAMTPLMERSMEESRASRSTEPSVCCSSNRSETSRHQQPLSAACSYSSALSSAGVCYIDKAIEELEATSAQPWPSDFSGLASLEDRRYENLVINRWGSPP